MRVGVVGVGAISSQYLDTLERLDVLHLAAIADLDPARAAAAAAARGVRACTVDELMHADDVDLVLNLTIPAAHAEVALRAIQAGKSVYGEKPLATTLADAREVLDAAAVAGVAVGCAPDTVLGTGIQTARKAIDDGLVGAPIAATAVMVVPGHERWHPNPDFYYQPGGGPLLDMGPYYITALVHLLGPVESVIGMSGHTRTTRTIGSGPRAGEIIAVEIDTHVTGALRHASGAISTLVMSFDAVGTRSASIEVHGDRASMSVPDPNKFIGAVTVRPLGETEWSELDPTAGYIDASRGIGIADLVASSGEPRATGEVAFHVLEVMLGVLEAARSGRTVVIASRCDIAAAVPLTESSGA
ncbi:Gfo/Idh/MocA family oxidoreductase [Microbacterium sp. BK668]|uniref:Gfo/Idh/MocA family protein n=1 Tax=Microbacterium sp. BK668 TaxID=2512118 RepID=UPI001FB84DD5|nr:Gfo/Idh/MocA family oxidoreductase [Microbacterium sp. BK668]